MDEVSILEAVYEHIGDRVIDDLSPVEIIMVCRQEQPVFTLSKTDFEDWADAHLFEWRNPFAKITVPLHGGGFLLMQPDGEEYRWMIDLIEMPAGVNATIDDECQLVILGDANE